MANLKNAAIREMVLDRCLRDHRRKYSTKDLMDACNRALSLEGYKEVTSLNTIRSDMRSIEHRWFEYGGIIEEEVVGRNKYYHYKNPTFSIYKTDLSQDDLNKLNQTLAVLSRFRGLPQFEWIDELNARFKSTFMSTPNTKTIISFDENIDAEGKQYISTLFEAIIEKNVLNISYKRFLNNESIIHMVHPYYLKEYNNRWFLLAYDEDYNMLTTFALDRIEAIKTENRIYQEICEINFNDYFDEVIGITVVPENEPRKLKIWVSSDQFPYIRTKPLHGTQKVLEEWEDGSKIIQIEVRENYELIQTLLSFGEKVILLEPQDIRMKIQKRIWLAGENYDKLK